MSISCAHFLVQAVFRIPSVPVGSRDIQFCFCLCVAHGGGVIILHGTTLDALTALFQTFLQTLRCYDLCVVACDEATRVLKEGSL